MSGVLALAPVALHIVARPMAATPCASAFELIAMAARTCNSDVTVMSR